MTIEDMTVGVVAAAPGADTNEYTLFCSVGSVVGGWTLDTPIANFGIDRVQVAWNNAASGTLKLYFSPDRGTTWNHDSSADQTLTANSGLTASPYDFAVAGYKDVKITLLNGGSAQTTWPPTIGLTRGQRQVVN